MGISCKLCSQHQTEDSQVIRLRALGRTGTEKIPSDFVNTSFVEYTNITNTSPLTANSPSRKGPPVSKKTSKKLISRRSKPRNSAFLNRTVITFYILGHIGCGKTSFLNKFMNGTYDTTYKHSEGVESGEKRIPLNHKFYDAKFIIPNKNLFSLKKNIENVDFVLLCYDINELNSFEMAKNIFENHLTKYQKRMEEKELESNVIMIGTKVDLDCNVDMENVKKYCKDNALSKFECSATEGKSIAGIIWKIVEVFDKDICGNK